MLSLLFTSGIFGEVKDNKINIVLGDSSVQTEYNYNSNSITNIEECLNIKLIGECFKDSQGLKLNKYNFFINNNGLLKNITNDMFKLEDKISKLIDLIDYAIFKDYTKSYFYKNIVPEFIATEGIWNNLCISKKKFEELLNFYFQRNFFADEIKRKLIYMYDLQSIVLNLKNSFFSVIDHYVFASEQLSKFVNSNFELYNMYFNDGEAKEYKDISLEAEILNSYFMTVIIRLCSTLDILSKLSCELINIPDDYDEFIKFKSGKIYFKKIGRFKEKFKNLKNYKGSIIEKTDSFRGIRFIRNIIIHNSFLSTMPNITVSYKNLDMHNYRLIFGKIYIWDVDKDGRPIRWCNRDKFYSQSRCIQKYLLQEILNFYFAFDKTIDLFIEYLEIKHG